EGGAEFTAVPGANAVLPALILSGLKSERFCFIGFLPDKSGDAKRLLESYSSIDATLVFYCAPHDLKKTVKLLFEALGDRKAVAVKEITKVFESRCEFTLSGFPDVDERGEFVILVEGKEKEDFSDLPVKEHIALYLAEGMSKMEAVKRVAKERGVPKSSLYKYTIDS
ncbi:MAG: 16S rRNA (cytidine(1402)-2'-O)-methyltransferase, partial [Clostridia bacterium]|nr:16S rRNA (cytidine(1402)-2'-O)-methyltransferase [Clostridia bacterium]